MGGRKRHADLQSIPAVFCSWGVRNEGYTFPANIPAGRYYATSWIDKIGNPWLFGGSLGTSLNDLWKFDLTTQQWTWMAGSTELYEQSGTYGSLGIADPANVPGDRNSSVGWTDNSGKLWLFGGFGAATGPPVADLDDLWEFDPSTSEWTWMGGSGATQASGDGQLGTYGTLGVPAATNFSGTRDGTVSWTDKSRNFWLFGGEYFYNSRTTIAALNDLWVYQPTPGTLPAAMPTFSTAAGSYNSRQTVTISDIAPGATIFYTTDGSSPSTNSTKYNGPVTISSTATVEAIAAAAGYANSDAASVAYTINLPDFSVSVTPGTLVVKSAAQGTAKFIVTPENGFNGAVTFACTGLPSGAACAFGPSTITPSGAALSTTLTITAQTLSGALNPRSTNLFPATALAITCLPVSSIDHESRPSIELRWVGFFRHVATGSYARDFHHYRDRNFRRAPPLRNTLVDSKLGPRRR